MNLNEALTKINQTRDGNSMVDIEFITVDTARDTGGDLRRVIGRRSGDSHDGRYHGTIVIESEYGEHKTLHIPLIMKVNGELVE